MLTTTEEGETWRDWCETTGLRDIYWSWEHLALWAAESDEILSSLERIRQTVTEIILYVEKELVTQ